MQQDKWKQLIDLVVNEEEEKASELFHEIVIENSREIYGNLINTEEAVDESEIDEVNADEVKDFIDDIEADEQGVSEEDDDAEEDDAEGLEDEMEIPSDGESDEPENADDMETRVVGVEDEVDAMGQEIADLKAEFEAMMNDEQEPEMEESVEEATDEAVEETVEEAVEEDDAEAVEEATEEESEEIVEYTEKAPAPKGGADDNAKSTVAKSGKGGIKNASSTEEKGGATPKSQSMGGTTKPDMKKV